jgi:hypothetical protein
VSYAWVGGFVGVCGRLGIHLLSSSLSTFTFITGYVLTTPKYNTHTLPLTVVARQHPAKYALPSQSNLGNNLSHRPHKPAFTLLRVRVFATREYKRGSGTLCMPYKPAFTLLRAKSFCGA